MKLYIEENIIEDVMGSIDGLANPVHTPKKDPNVSPLIPSRHKKFKRSHFGINAAAEIF